jgi:hypothetical protein
LQAEAEKLLKEIDAKAKTQEGSAQVGSSSKVKQRCTMCSKTGHNKRTCQKDVAEIDN